MKSRSTEKKRKGNRKQSFKKRNMKGGALPTFDWNNPKIQLYTLITPSYACDFKTDSINITDNKTVITNKKGYLSNTTQTTEFTLNPLPNDPNDPNEKLKWLIMNKLIEFVFTNNTKAFINTIQCCYGLKRHTDKIMSRSNVTSQIPNDNSGNQFNNVFKETGTNFIFALFNSTNSTKSSLLEVAATWGNDTILEILLDIAGDYVSPPILDDLLNKPESNDYIDKLNAIHNNNTKIEIQYGPIYSALTDGNQNDIVNNVPNYVERKERCKILLQLSQINFKNVNSIDDRAKINNTIFITGNNWVVIDGKAYYIPTAPDADSENAVPAPAPDSENAVPDPDSENAVPAPDSENTDLVPDPVNTDLVPDSENTDLVPDSENTAPVPDSENTDLVPDSENTDLVPDSENTDLVPDPVNTAPVPDSENTDLVPDPVNPAPVDNSDENNNFQPLTRGVPVKPVTSNQSP